MMQKTEREIALSRMLMCIFFMLFVSFVLTGCNKGQEEPFVEFETTEGTFVVRLYKETPKHRDNVVKLVEEGFYDGLLFHRVRSGFVVETGDPDSRTKGRGRRLGTGGPGYTIEQEIDTMMDAQSHRFHFRGALSACRLPDDVNRERKSNGSQFFITVGRKWTDTELDSLENQDYESQLNLVLQGLVMKNRAIIENSRLSSGGHQNVLALEDSLAQEAATLMETRKTLKFTPLQRSLYADRGGEPEMDGRYTVFGEVTEGLDVIMKISEAMTDVYARPLQDIKIVKARVR